jgi:hypothetical protein
MSAGLQMPVSKNVTGPETPNVIRRSHQTKKGDSYDDDCEAFAYLLISGPMKLGELRP